MKHKDANARLDQLAIQADAAAFEKIMVWMDTPATAAETKGMKRILKADVPWDRDLILHGRL
ncbi:MAG: hypothetical protein ABL901_06525 [Hyphomicrobiaceae bacterium]